MEILLNLRQVTIKNIGQHVYRSITPDSGI